MVKNQQKKEQGDVALLFIRTIRGVCRKVLGEKSIPLSYNHRIKKASFFKIKQKFFYLF
ncbi:MAG: hypothetical protein IKL48_06740 [Elusimicrobiaceae bacterium]|nr:hypothetical protein [Elusimicrobiaceae bacterium]